MIFQTDRKATRTLTGITKKTKETHAQAMSSALACYKWITDHQAKKRIIVVISPKKKEKYMQALWDLTHGR